MNLPEDGVLLRIFVGESDQHHGRPVYERIVLKARELNLAGATVVRGIMGFGASSRVHSAKFLRLSEDLPVVVEIVDTEEKLQPLLRYLEDIGLEGLATMERVRIVSYRHRRA